MSTRTILRMTLRWHMGKARRLFRLLAGWLAPSPERIARPTGVRWG